MTILIQEFCIFIFLFFLSFFFSGGYDQVYEYDSIIKTMAPGPPGSVETDDLTDENIYVDSSNVTTDTENETELMFNEDEDAVILLHEDDEQSSASSGSNAPDLIKKDAGGKTSVLAVKEQRAAQVLSPEGGNAGGTLIASRRRQRTLSSNGALLGTSSSRRHDGILRTLTRTIYTAGRPPWYDAAGQHVEPCVIGMQIQY